MEDRKNTEEKAKTNFRKGNKNIWKVNVMRH